MFLFCRALISFTSIPAGEMMPERGRGAKKEGGNR
jgi:hypothetical protein